MAFIFVGGAFVSSLWAAGPSQRFVLDNGLVVLISEMPTSPMVSVYGLVRTGSAREGEFVGSGISHFLEHMLFQGAHGQPGGALAAKVQAVGGNINASTGQDFTIYTVNVPNDHFEMALDTLTGMLFNAPIDPQEVEKERDVIFAEMRLHKDNPDSWLGRLAFQNSYLKHTYRHPVIGYEDLFGRITREELWQYYKQHYAPNNIILSVAGNIKTEEIKGKIIEKLNSIPRQPFVLDIVPQEPPQISARRFEEEYPTDLARLSMAFQGVSLLNEDMYALDVLAVVMGQGESSRLYQKLYKEKGIAYSVYASNYTPVDPGLFEVEALCETKNVKEIETTVWQEVDTLKSKGVTKAELEKAQRQVLSDYIKGNQKASSVAWHQAVDETFAGDYTFSQKYVEEIKKVKTQDIQRVARAYLRPERLSVTVLKPAGQQDETPLPQPEAAQEEIQKVTLDNGISILLRKDATFPLVSVRVMFKGGLIKEPPSINGVSQLMAHVWTKGTKSLSSQQIEEMTEGLGIDLSAYAGNNSFGLSMSLLSQDTKTALDLLGKIITQPVFPADEIKRKKEDMLKAIRQRDENIFPLTSFALRKNLFEKHPYRMDSLGTNETLVLIEQKDIAAYYSDWAVPNNMVVSVFGDIDPPEVLAQLRSFLGSLKRKDVVFEKHEEELIREPKRIAVQLNKEQALVMIGFHGVDMYHPDRYGLEVLGTYMGSSFSGRLFNSIREELGKAYTMGDYQMPGLDTGLIAFYVLTEKEAVETIEQIIRKEIRLLQEELAPLQEVEDIKTYLKGNFKAGLETNDALSFTSGLDELYGLGYEEHKNYEKKIGAVTPEDIQRLARTYLDFSKAVTVITAP